MDTKKGANNGRHAPSRSIREQSKLNRKGSTSSRTSNTLPRRAASPTISISSTSARGSISKPQVYGSSPVTLKTKEHTKRSSGVSNSQVDLNGGTSVEHSRGGNVIVHPFANTTSKLEIIPSSSNPDGIDVQEESKLYDELCRNYEDETDNFSRSDTPTVNPSNKLTKPKSKGPQNFRPPSLPPPSTFSADIFLADNTGHGPLFAQDITIAGWTTVGEGAMGMKVAGGAYVVYDCVITMKEGTTMHVLKRYSAFEELRDKLKKSLPQHLIASLPSLPPKSALARFRPAFLDARRKLLQFFLASVLLHPEIGGREEVRKWVLS